MAITIEQREEITALVVGMFNAVPGTTYLTLMVNAIDDGATLAQLADVLEARPEFESVYPNFATSEEFAAELVANLLGTEVSAEAAAWSTDWVEAQLSSGMSKAEVILTAIQAIRSTTNENYAAAQAALANKVDVATYYSVTLEQSSTDLADLQDVIAGITSDVATVEAAKAEILDDANNATGEDFDLTAGVDSVVGTSGNDVINANTTAANLATLTALDNLNGGEGQDTLNITSTIAIVVPTSATVQNVETANLASAAEINGDFSTWAGLETLNITSATTAATAQSYTVGAADVAVTTVYTDAANDAPDTTGTITVAGGQDVSINALVSGEFGVGEDTTVGTITVVGDANTTSVSVTQTAPATGAAAVKGVINGTVAITDVNATSATSAGHITTVSLNNFGAATVNSGALATLNLSGKGASVDASVSGALTTATATTVGLNLAGFTSTGAVTLDTDVKTVNVDSSTAASTLASLSAAGATAVNISGDKAVTFTGNTFAATAAITSTNTAGVTLGTAIAVGSSFAGGDGADTIALTANGTKAITMGAGNDSVTYAGALATGGSVDGGEGTDTIKMTDVLAATATGSTTFAGTVSNFEVLELSTATTAATAINMANADGINSLATNGVGATFGLTVTNAAANFTLTQKAAMAAASSIALATDIGTADSVNLSFSAADGFANTAALTVANVESLNITTTDTSAVGANTAVFTAPIVAAAASTVTVSGSLGISLIGGMTQATLTSLDASGLTATGALGGLTWTSGALTAAATVNGGAAGTNVIDFSAATKAVTYTGGTGVDTINFAAPNAQANVINLGNGANVVNGGTNATGNNTITGGTGIDTILVANGNNTINAGDGADVLTIGTGANTLTLGAGADVVNFADNSASSAVFTTITDIAVGDVLDFTGVVAVTNTAGALGAALTSGVSDYQTFLNAAAGQNAGTVSWFQFGGDTYVAVEVAGNDVFDAGADHVVKLTGLIDLSTATIAAGDLLTIA